ILSHALMLLLMGNYLRRSNQHSLTTLIDHTFAVCAAYCPHCSGECSMKIAAVIVFATMALGVTGQAQGESRFQPGWHHAPPPGITLTTHRPRHALALQGNPHVHPIYLRQVVP